MISKTIPVLVFTTTIWLGEAAPNVGIETLHAQERSGAMTTEKTEVSPTNNSSIAQLFYPAVRKQNAIMVVGQGWASVTADGARVVFAVSNNDPSGSSEGAPSKPERKAVPLTREILNPIVNAISATGVPANAIEVYINPVESSSAFSQGGARVLVRLDKPTRERVQRTVTAASTAASKSGKLFLQSVDVQYAVNDCPSLERKAYLAAMNDARERAEALAKSMNVQVNNIPSIAEEPITRLVSACNSEINLSSLPFGSFTSSYDPAAPAEVKLWRNVFATYTIK